MAPSSSRDDERSGDVTEAGSHDAESDDAEENDADETTERGDAGARGRAPARRTREVEVPLRVYKTVTVFATLFSVTLVVGGFIVLDAATQRTQLELEEINPLLALVGLAMIVAGAALYAFSTRFRARGMGKPKESGDETSDNG